MSAPAVDADGFLNLGFRVGTPISLLAAGFGNFVYGWHFSTTLLAWIVPLLSRSVAGATLIPLGLFVELALFAFVLRRAALDRASHAVDTHRVAQA